MRFLRKNTAVRITVGPFLDKTDGVTSEVALTVTSCKLTATVDADDGSGVTLVLDTNPTASGGSNDMVHITGDDAGYYDLELAAANINYNGRFHLAITDAATHCPVFHEFTILPALVYDSLIAGSDNLQVDTVQVSGTAQTARDIGASILLSNGTGAGQVSLTSGKVDVNDKTGFALSSAGVQAIWDALTSALTTAGSIGKKLADWVLGSDSKVILSNNAHTGATIPTVTDVTNTVGITTAAQDSITDKVWDEAISGHLGAGSTGEKLNSAASAGDPWTTAVPGAYGAGTAGKILGDNLNAAVSSRSSHSAADVWAVGTRTLTSFGTLVSDIWSNSTRTLTAFSTALAVSVWDVLESAIATANSIGLKLKTNLDATVSSRLSSAGYTAPDNAGISSILSESQSHPTLAEIEATTVLAKEATVAAIKTKTDTIVWTDITDIKDESLGKWSINKSTNVLTFYKADGVTALKQFNLTDNASVSERVPV